MPTRPAGLLAALVMLGACTAAPVDEPQRAADATTDASTDATNRAADAGQLPAQPGDQLTAAADADRNTAGHPTADTPNRAAEAEPWPRPEPILRLSFTPADRPLEEALRAHLDAGRVRVERWFGRPMPETLVVQVHPDRAAFDASFPAEWGIRTQCWMVAYGVADTLSVLSPRAWDAQCEHDGDDTEHVAGILAHEVVHVFHGQHNPTRDFTGAEELGWFAEGLAVLVSGQLEGDHADAAAEALAAGAGPVDLANAWSGPWRYGVCGSLVAEVERRVGREGVFELLTATTNAELLDAVGLDEAGLLEAWAAGVRAAGAGNGEGGTSDDDETAARPANAASASDDTAAARPIDGAPTEA